MSQIERMSLGEVIDIDRNQATTADCGCKPYVGLEHVEAGTGRLSAFYNAGIEPALTTKFCFTPEHILYGKLRPYLNKVWRASFHGTCSTELLPLRPKTKLVSRDFLAVILLSPPFVKWASENVSGANLPRLNPERLLEYVVSLPTLDEQQRLAARLARADRLRRTRRFALQLSGHSRARESRRNALSIRCP